MNTRSKHPTELAESFQSRILETTRRTLAMRRYHQGRICRWRRAARSGPNSDIALVFVWDGDAPPEVEIWPYAKVERLAAEVTDEEVFAELNRWASRTVEIDES
ncbi:MAG: hypothetical protein H7A46_21390 [Verrucomicrobiales bacterium]|nr:hypothetical protein [Verrucomicrobiales bacterium]